MRVSFTANNQVPSRKPQAKPSDRLFEETMKNIRQMVNPEVKEIDWDTLIKNSK